MDHFIAVCHNDGLYQQDSGNKTRLYIIVTNVRDMFLKLATIYRHRLKTKLNC